MDTLSNDPKKRSVQMIEIGFLLVLLPIAGWMGRAGWDESARITRARAFVAQADAEFHQGQLEEAIGTSERALSEDPRCYEAYQNLSAFLWLTQRKPQAIQIYQRALVFLPDDGRVHKDIGELFMAEKQFALAAQHFSRATQLLPPTLALAKELDLAQRKAQEAATTAVKPGDGSSPAAPASGSPVVNPSAAPATPSPVAE